MEEVYWEGARGVEVKGERDCKRPTSLIALVGEDRIRRRTRYDKSGEEEEEEKQREED